ncbi:hypothetical protein [Castellaniella sp.]|uniref:hypothetical protein n=1 Tax=Castellaniella sp. TaxID=1955812 RepID=UPI002AFEDBFB|nr:hypothetical protein [Castellaniella sp.]
MTTIADFADALIDRLRPALDDIPTISADPPPRKHSSLRVPAIYVEIDDFESLSEAGDTRLLTDVRWMAHCIVDPTLPRADLALRSMAARVAVALHEIRRPVPGHGHIRLARAGEDAFRPALDGYLCWVVEFNIEIALGELEPVGITPSEIYISQSPAIGTDHSDDYERLA